MILSVSFPAHVCSAQSKTAPPASPALAATAVPAPAAAVAGYESGEETYPVFTPSPAAVLVPSSTPLVAFNPSPATRVTVRRPTPASSPMPAVATVNAIPQSPMGAPTGIMYAAGPATLPPGKLLRNSFRLFLHYSTGMGHGIVHMYYRTHTGEVRGATYTPTPSNGTPVPSFTPFVDDFLDRFGYSSALIEILYDALTASPTRADFVCYCTQRGVARLEAKWFYILLEGVHTLDMPRRRRNVIVPV